MSTKVNKKFLSPLYLTIGIYRIQILSIERFIIERRLAQSDFARYFGLDPTYFNKILRGRVVINGAIFSWILYTIEYFPHLVVDWCVKRSATQRVRGFRGLPF